ncbi:MAG: hypothetical protein RLZ66_1919, partial [Pseudomonadota bacterium]
MIAATPTQHLRVMFDASALTPRYAQEPGHDRVQDLCARAT